MKAQRRPLLESLLSPLCKMPSPSICGAAKSANMSGCHYHVEVCFTSSAQVLSPGFGTQTCEWELETRALARLRSPVLGAVHMWHYTGYPIGDDCDGDVEGTELRLIKI